MAEATALVQDAYPHLPLSAEQPMSTPAAALLTESRQAQEVVVGAKGEDIGNVALGSTTLQLVGHAASPVIVVGHPSAGHRRLVIGTDGSPDSTAPRLRLR